MKKQKVVSLLLCLSMALTACAASTEQVLTVTPAVSSSAQTVPAAQTSEKTEETVGASVFTNQDLDASYSESDSIAIVLNGNSISCDSSSVSVSGSTVTISKEGTYVLSGTLEDGSIVVDADKTDKIQLVLSGVSIHSETSAPIYVRQADKVFVTLASGTQNSMSNGGSFTADGDTNIDAVIFSRDDLTLNGSGALTITSPGGHGIVSKDSLRVAGGSYAMDVSDHGLSGQDEVSIANGTFDIVAGKDGIHAENSEDADAGFVYLENGTYRITAGGDGISASGSCQIVDGDYTITTGGGSETVQRTTSSQGFGRGQFGGSTPTDRPQFDAQNMPERGTGGKGGMDGSGFGRRNDTFAASGDTPSIVISGGSVSITASADGIDANGTLEITGGTVIVSGPTFGDTAVLDFDRSGTISGGTFIGTGAASMAQTFSGNTQGVISVNAGSQSSGTQITLTDSSGSVILSHTPELDFEVVILSCPAIQTGESYTLRVGNTTQNFTAK